MLRPGEEFDRIVNQEQRDSDKSESDFRSNSKYSFLLRVDGGNQNGIVRETHVIADPRGDPSTGTLYFLSRFIFAQPSFMTCFARPNASESGGTSSVIHEAAAT